jgi:hypothetical protein
MPDSLAQVHLNAAGRSGFVRYADMRRGAINKSTGPFRPNGLDMTYVRPR